jgi:hypothetical protein
MSSGILTTPEPSDAKRKPCRWCSWLGKVSICDILARLPATPKSCCLPVPSQIVHDPDPETYDQRLVFALGGVPTFNSPDLDTVDIWPLRPSGNLTATVRNLSNVASANQTRVDLSWSAWGIGMVRQPIGTTFVDLARAGFPGSQKTISWPIPPAVKDERVFGFFVDLLHPYDSDPANNHGEQTVDGFQTSAGRSKTFVVPVRNPTASTQTISLTAGPAPLAPWVTITPATFTLGGGAQKDVMVAVNVPAAVPASPSGTFISATVDVLATIGGAYLGGVSILILFDA